MKTALAALAAVAALTAVAAPAAAQPYGGSYDREIRQDRDWNRGGYNINERQAQLDRRIDAGVRRGDLTRREAFRLRAEFREIARLEARYRHDGRLSNWERADLDRRFDRLDAQIRFERHDRDDRGDHRRY